MSPEDITEVDYAEQTTRPAIVDIELEPLVVWRAVLIALPVGLLIGIVMAGVVVLIVRNFNPQPTPPQGLIYVPFIFIALFVPSLILLTKWRERRACRLMVEELAAHSASRSESDSLPPCQGGIKGDFSQDAGDGNAEAETQQHTIGQSIEAVLTKTLHRRFFGLGAIPRRRRFRSRTMVILRGITRGLVAGGAKGLIVRACKKEHALEIQPIEVPIEPLPVDESVPFVALLGDENQNDFETIDYSATTVQDEDDRSRTPDESDFRRKLKRSVTLIGGRWAFAGFALIWVVHAIQALLTWRITWWFLIWTGVMIMFIFDIGGRGAWRAGQQWLMVPGGLVTRKGNRRGGWDVHLFDRRTSVLTAYRHMRNQWAICVADEQKHQMAMVTPTESTALLRAWLSPLPPPRVEQLQELAG